MKDDTHEEMQNLYARLRMLEEQLDGQNASLIKNVAGMTREAGIPRELWGISHLIGEVADDLWELSKQYEKEVVVYRTKSEILDEVAGVMFDRLEEHIAIHGEESLSSAGKTSPQKETGKVIQFDCTRKNNDD